MHKKHNHYLEIVLRWRAVTSHFLALITLMLLEKPGSLRDNFQEIDVETAVGHFEDFGPEKEG